MFEFSNTWVFFLLPLPFIVWWVLPPMRRRANTLIAPFAAQAAVASKQKLRRSAWISKRNALQWILLFLAWLCLLGALARPQLVGQPEMKVKTARSFLVAADISFSMAARDWVKNDQRFTRWEGVKEVMGEFISRREGDRMGLVFFGTNAYLQTPFTSELDIVEWFLDETDVGMAGQMTSIGKAIGFGIRLFEQDTLDHKVMLLLTDGSDGGKGITPLDAAYMAQKDSIKIYTLGIGDPDAPGSDLDEESLKAISEITGGQYFRAIDHESLSEAYELLDQLEPMEFEEEEYKPVTELYYYPTVASIVIALLLLFIRSIIAAVKRT
ncbi:VWA domain-containing protein [Carboxylicivirga sp. RSCT41]|uniref:VWA domain-containing protein n=1 Tax=Carboxylicivirga agarovorans TaxID=3417570 RepID=UPI003D32CE88